MVVPLACFAQAHEKDVTVLLLILTFRLRCKIFLKDSLTCSSKSSRLRIWKYGNTQREIYYMYCCPVTQKYICNTWLGLAPDWLHGLAQPNLVRAKCT